MLKLAGEKYNCSSGGKGEQHHNSSYGHCVLLLIIFFFIADWYFLLKSHPLVVRGRCLWELLLCAVERQRLGTSLVTPLHSGWREGGCLVTAVILPGGSGGSLVLLARWLWFQSRALLEMEVFKTRGIRQLVCLSWRWF